MEFIAILKNYPLMKPKKVVGGCVEVGVLDQNFVKYCNFSEEFLYISKIFLDLMLPLR